MTRCALYLRVSKDDDSQTPENQRRQLLDYAECRGWTITEVYEDRATGTKGRADRAAFDAMFRDAHRRRFDLVLFWSLDRFSREGLRQVFAYLDKLRAHGVGFHSYTEEYLSTESPFAEVMIALTSWFAHYEARRISERTKAGLERARANGKRIGRPSAVERHYGAVLDARAADPSASMAALAERVGTSTSTVRRILAKAGAAGDV